MGTHRGQELHAHALLYEGVEEAFTPVYGQEFQQGRAISLGQARTACDTREVGVRVGR